jgi:hypothetical protein
MPDRVGSVRRRAVGDYAPDLGGAAGLALRTCDGSAFQRSPASAVTGYLWAS